MKQKNIFIFIYTSIVILTILVFWGCQAVFTTSPLAFLQRDPKTLSDDQKKEYAEQALASGDEEAMEDALDAMEDILKDDPDDAEANQLAGNLAIELSGAPEVFTDMMEDPDNAPSDMGEFIDSQDDDELELFIDGAHYIETAEENDAEITPMEYLMASFGLAAEAEENGEPVPDKAKEYRDKGLEAVPEDMRDSFTLF